MNSINRILNRYRRSLYPVVKGVKRVTTSRFDTSDIVQESMLQIWVEMRNDEESTFSANNGYLAKVGYGNTHRQHRQHLAQRRSINSEADVSVGDFAQSQVLDPQEKAQKDEMLLVLVQAIGSLKPDLRLVIFRRFFDQKTYQEIAIELGISIDVVRNYQKRAIKQLKKLLSSELID